MTTTTAPAAELVASETYRGHELTVTRVPAEIGDRSARGEHLKLRQDGGSFYGWSAALGNGGYEHVPGEGYRLVPNEVPAAEIDKAAGKLIKKGRAAVDRAELEREHLPRLQATCAAWTDEELAAELEAGRVVEVTEPLEAGDLVICHGHGRKRAMVVTRVTKTVAHGLFVTPSSPNHVTAGSVKLDGALRPAGYPTSAQVARAMAEPELEAQELEPEAPAVVCGFCKGRACSACDYTGNVSRLPSSPEPEVDRVEAEAELWEARGRHDVAGKVRELAAGQTGTVTAPETPETVALRRAVKRHADRARVEAAARDRAIVELRAAGATLRELGELAGVSHVAIGKLLARTEAAETEADEQDPTSAIAELGR